MRYGLHSLELARAAHRHHTRGSVADAACNQPHTVAELTMAHCSQRPLHHASIACSHAFMFPCFHVMPTNHEVTRAHRTAAVRGEVVASTGACGTWAPLPGDRSISTCGVGAKPQHRQAQYVYVSAGQVPFGSKAVLDGHRHEASLHSSLLGSLACTSKVLDSCIDAMHTPCTFEIWRADPELLILVAAGHPTQAPSPPPP